MTDDMRDICGASIRGLFDSPIGPCVLRADHRGPVHQAADGSKWSEAATPVPADDLRDRIAEAIPYELIATPAVGIGDARRDKIARAVMPAVQPALDAKDAEVERLRGELEHTKAALAGTSESARLLMLDYAALTEKYSDRARQAESEVERLREQFEDELERARQAEEDEFVAENRAKRAEAAIEQVRFRLGQSIFHPPECLGRFAGDNPDCTMCGIIRDLNETAQQQEDTDD